MKALTIFPILAASGNHNMIERGYDGWTKISDISQYSEECSNQVPSKGGIFVAPNYGNRGEITLDKYSTKLRCLHVVQADSSCSEIKISYRNIAVMTEWDLPICTYDGFRFGWGDEVTPLRCNCFGDGCSHDTMSEYFNSAKYYGHDYLGPNEFTINSNSFTFYFESGTQYNWNEKGESVEFSWNGHVVLDWECVARVTTTVSTTTT